MNNKVIVVALSIGCLILGFLYYKEKTSLPIKLTICDKDYQLCFLDSAYKDISSCERANTKNDRLCDEKDPENIICKASSSTIAVGYCK